MWLFIVSPDRTSSWLLSLGVAEAYCDASGGETVIWHASVVCGASTESASPPL